VAAANTAPKRRELNECEKIEIILLQSHGYRLCRITEKLQRNESTIRPFLKWYNERHQLSSQREDQEKSFLKRKLTAWWQRTNLKIYEPYDEPKMGTGEVISGREKNHIMSLREYLSSLQDPTTVYFSYYHLRALQLFAAN
jgi:hypothetical protein